VANSPVQGDLFARIWPSALLVAGLGLTVAWMALLAYGFVGFLVATL
jgi:hypothetical protein